MEDVDERYENGVIYMLKHKTDDTKEYYIGSSYDFKTRCGKHKRNCNKQNSKEYNLKVYKYIRENDGFYEWRIVKLYDYPCKNRNELHLEERRAIKLYKSTLNTNVPCRTKKEYYDTNREEIAQRVKEYRKNNKEKIQQQEKEKYQKNKEKISQQRKEYYDTNREEIVEKKKIKINCDICNAIVRKGEITRHKRSEKCKNSHK